MQLIFALTPLFHVLFQTTFISEPLPPPPCALSYVCLCHPAPFPNPVLGCTLYKIGFSLVSKLIL